jgi:putative ABC transport system permease protein
MSDLRLALAYLRARMLVTVLTVVSVALGLGLAVAVLQFSHQTKDTLVKEAGYYDLVVGAKGSPLQLVLNGLYYLDAPVGNIDVRLWHELEKDPAAELVVPLTMGDNYLGSPIVGTTPDFLKNRKATGGGTLLAQGRMFEKPFEATVGAQVARLQHVTLGQQLVGAHGWTKSDDLHPQFPYTVVGIMASTGTAVDRAVYTDYHSTWIVHSHPDADEAAEAHEHHADQELTSVLVRLSQPGRRFMMVRHINEHGAAMAAVPVDQISRLVGVFIAPLQGMLLLVAYLVVVVAALSILIGLYLTIHQRRRDIAILRAVGATRLDVFRMITVEAATIAGFGVVFGWLCGHGLVAALSPLLATRFGIVADPWQLQPLELGLGISVWLLGILAGLLPAAMAYRLPVAEALTAE